MIFMFLISGALLLHSGCVLQLFPHVMLGVMVWPLDPIRWHLTFSDLDLRPPRDLTLVLDALTSVPFEPLGDIRLNKLSLKTALLLALTSVKLVGTLTALSVNATCVQFAVGDSKVILRQPKIITSDLRYRVIELPAIVVPPISLGGSVEGFRLCAQGGLCVIKPIILSLFARLRSCLCVGAQALGRVLLKQRLSH